MKRFNSLFPIVLMVIALSACSPEQETASQSENLSESARLTDFFAKNFEQDLKDSPMRQSYLGYKWDYDKWNTITEVKADADAQKRRQRLQAISQFDQNQLNDKEKLSLTINRLALERSENNDEFRHHTYIMHQFRAWHTRVPSFLINIHRVTELSDAEAYVSRLEKVAPLFNQVVDQLRLREAKGVFPPKWSYDQMIVASRNVISGQPFDDSESLSTIWSDFNHKVDTLELDSKQADKLKQKAKDALLTSVKPAYENIIKELTRQRSLTPAGDGVWRLPDGDKWYANRLAWFTTTDLTANEVHELGLQHVQRIHKQMRDIMQTVGFEGSLNEFFDFMRADQQFYYPNTEQGRQRYLTEAAEWVAKMREVIPEYFGLQPKADMIVKRVEAFREKSAGKAFYQSPAKDGSRPGIYYANLYDMNSMPIYQMEALAFHEGIPGHHMQRTITQELDGIPEFQKYVSFTAYTEGWGLYTEELAKDMGFYQDPYSDFGRLAMELWRACRLVVDTGIHSKKWTREEAIQYLTDNTPNPQNDAVKAIERYIAMPGQATAYMIGKLKIMELRAWAREQLGEQFDIRGFHDEVLKDGPVPLNVLEEKIKRWVGAQK
ncbi:DUF885 domain-containing protein [bacterium SCSIO 12696]|nr:DUF885 domain-containing protein [bacterium SCSIO 12696]